ncbi:Hypothetical predicted protein [Mytilus galloprovincialis]|nr:Hypothetical predicted protein [Mytilus galloprovincialis]
MTSLLFIVFCLVTVASSNPYQNSGHYTGYVGCFVDDANRLLKYRIQFLHQITLAKCRHHCWGYKYLGLQARDFCLCGNSLYRPAYPQASELQCNSPCAGEYNRMCGADWRNSIYKV